MNIWFFFFFEKEWTFDLKGERMSGILYTLIGDGTWPKKGIFQEKNL